MSGTVVLASQVRDPFTSKAKVPRRKDDRIILHFDYDAFYGSVFENEEPSLRALPLGVQQKTILATCNYVARARGVRKLMLISDARKACPDLVLRNGEDLTRFRDVSKRLWGFLRLHSWNHRVERLGLDEVFLDVSDIIEYNRHLLDPHALTQCFFHLSRDDPEKGFEFDATSFSGCVYPPATSSWEGDADFQLANPLYARLLLASHLAGYLRRKLEVDFGYTSTCGIATNRVLAKLAGNANKPKNQTTMLSIQDETVRSFMNKHRMREIPGLGSKTSHLVENYVLSKNVEAIPHNEEHWSKVTVLEVLSHPNMSPALLEKILGGSGAEKGIGEKTWNLLHGIDHTEVKEASDVPKQISIEDTWVSRTLNTQAELMRELQKISASLITRMRRDLLIAEDDGSTGPSAPRWLAYPRTLRLSTRVKGRAGTGGTGPERAQQPQDKNSNATTVFNRSSRSQPLPTFVFGTRDPPDGIAGRLVAEAVLPLFRRLHPERQGWNLALINICVTNMAVAGGEDNAAGGRDISAMFRTQGVKLREWTVYNRDEGDAEKGGVQMQLPAQTDERLEANWAEGAEQMDMDVEEALLVDDDVSDMTPQWEGEDGIWDVGDEEETVQKISYRCNICGEAILEFAILAHTRFHEMEESNAGREHTAATG